MADWTFVASQLKGKTRRLQGECSCTFEAEPSPGRAVLPEPALE